MRVIRFRPDRVKGGPLSVLCLGSHSDDIEIGCGGTLLQLVRQQPEVHFHWVVFSARGMRKDEAVCASKLFTEGAELKTARFLDFRDGFLPFTGAEIKEVFEELKQTAPDLIFTQYGKDAHQDHRLTAEMTWSTFRNHMIFEYEIPKWDGDMGTPNVFVPLEKETCEGKIARLFTAFKSQQDRPWFKPETFSGLMRLRGMECNSPSGYAEAFYCRKMVL